MSLSTIYLLDRWQGAFDGVKTLFDFIQNKWPIWLGVIVALIFVVRGFAEDGGAKAPKTPDGIAPAKRSNDGCFIMAILLFVVVCVLLTCHYD